MTRVKGGTVSKDRRRKVLKQAKGYFGSKHRLYKTAQEQVMHSLRYAFRDRKQNKRNFRKLWITRINAACRENDISYSKFIAGLSKAGIEINRKMLAELAVSDAEAFKNIVKIAKDANDGKIKAEVKKEVKSEVKAEVKAEVKVEEKVSEKETPKKTTTAKKTATKSTTKKTTAKTTTAKKTTTKSAK
ncbi:MAG: 50S ribosomal protein L20 [Bacilli bacterium]|nr:50S ribosomal protein L20 [Bacilli bacterium]